MLATYFAYFDGGLIDANQIKNYNVARVSGMTLYDCNGVNGDPLIVSNNTFSIGGTQDVHGVYIYSSSYLLFAHNSILLTNSNPSSKALYDGAYNYNSSLLNNVFQNIGGGYALYMNNSYSSCGSNFNNIYTSGGNYAYFSGTAALDLASWQTTANKDTNSVSVDALFLDTNDLHAAGIGLNGTGTALARNQEFNNARHWG